MLWVTSVFNMLCLSHRYSRISLPLFSRTSKQKQIQVSPLSSRHVSYDTHYNHSKSRPKSTRSLLSISLTASTTRINSVKNQICFAREAFGTQLVATASMASYSIDQRGSLQSTDYRIYFSMYSLMIIFCFY